MRSLVAALCIVFAIPAHAEDALPPEVERFIQDRDACDHFRGEPAEGNTPAQIERRNFIIESLEIYCPGTDRRLAALKARYKDDPDVMKRLNVYEAHIEAAP